MKKIVLLVIILCWLCAPNTQAQYGETALPYATWNVPAPENISPVETSYNEYASLIDWRQSGNGGDLRARPTDVSEYDKPQKVPFGNASWWMAAFALLLYVAY
jgi:hypothetical protein